MHIYKKKKKRKTRNKNLLLSAQISHPRPSHCPESPHLRKQFYFVLFWCVEIFFFHCFNYLNPSDNATLSLAKLQITAGHFGAVGYRQTFGLGFTALSPFLYLVRAFKGCPFPLHPFCLYSHCTAVTVLLPVTFCCMSCYLNLPSHFLSHRLHCTTAPSPPRSRSIHQSLL